MLTILLSVAAISTTGVMMPGLMFGVTLAKSLKNPWAGTWISIGHAVIEMPLMLLVYFGFGRFFENNIVQIVLSVLGGVMVVWLGISLFRSRNAMVYGKKDLPYSSFVAGIVTTAVNPFFWLWWATIGTMLVMKITPFGVTGLTLLIIVHWLCDLIWCSSISNVVYRTHKLWGKKFQAGVFIASSLLLVGFGIWYVASTFL